MSIQHQRLLHESLVNIYNAEAQLPST